jgi:phosphate transport system protein
MRIRYTEELATLNRELTEMGAMCEDVITKAGEAMITGNALTKDSVKTRSEEIDRKERIIENLCIRLLLQEQPVAGDLRMISAALKMITDMERIGDQAEEIAGITEYLEDSTSRVEGMRIGGTHIKEMAKAIIKMVNESVEAFVKQETGTAKQVIGYDDVVDGLFKEVKRDLIDLIRMDSRYGEYAMDLLMIAKYFEKIGDHAVNIAEWVIFAVTGERP